MRRRLAHPYGHTISPSRVLSLLMALAVLGALYARFKDPATWAWMTHEKVELDATIAVGASEQPAANATPKEKIVPGPNEGDADELVKLRRVLKVVTDKRPLEPHEMLAYWQLMGWSRTRPFAELERAAQKGVLFSQIWEQPDLYRGHAIRLRLHVRRVLKYAAPKNDLGLKEVFECWGWTDDSLSHPYVVVFPELPAGLKVGDDVGGEIVFVGYFLKWMNYRAFDVSKNSPLLVGRARPASGLGGPKKPTNGWETAFLTIAAVVLGVGCLSWFGLNSWRQSRSSRLANAELPESLPEAFFAPRPESALPDFPEISDFAEPPKPG